MADEVWIATALLHREHPERQDFRIQEIVQRVAQENLAGRLRPGVVAHVSSHCVSNRAPDPARLRMLYATGRSTRRLYRPGDPIHPERKGKMLPERTEIPRAYHDLLDWCEKEFGNSGLPVSGWLQGVAEMRGLGKQIWAGEDPDEYVRQLREGWD